MSEVWVGVPSFEDLYEVSSLGQVRSLKRKALANYGERTYGGKVLRPIVRKRDGYLVVNLYRESVRYQRSLHSLVATAFLGEAPHGKECCHKNGIRSDCRLENLRWGNPVENAADKVDHGTVMVGSKNGSAKLDESQVRAILACRGSHSSVAKEYGVSAVLVGLIRAGKAWKHVSRAAFGAENQVRWTQKDNWGGRY